MQLSTNVKIEHMLLCRKLIILIDAEFRHQETPNLRQAVIWRLKQHYMLQMHCVLLRLLS